MTVQRVPSGHVPSTVHPWSSSAAAPAVPGACVVVTPEQAGGSSHAGAGAPFRLNMAVGLNPGAYLGRSHVSERLIINERRRTNFSENFKLKFSLQRRKLKNLFIADDFVLKVLDSY